MIRWYLTPFYAKLVGQVLRDPHTPAQVTVRPSTVRVDRSQVSFESDETGDVEGGVWMLYKLYEIRH